MNTSELKATLSNALDVFSMVYRFIPGEPRIKAVEAVMVRIEKVLKELESENCKH